LYAARGGGIAESGVGRDADRGVGVEARIGQLRVLPEQTREVFLRRVQGRFSTLESRLQMSTEPTKIPSVRYSFLERAVGTPQ
jgi:hypothetical protein